MAQHNGGRERDITYLARTLNTGALNTGALDASFF